MRRQLKICKHYLMSVNLLPFCAHFCLLENFLYNFGHQNLINIKSAALQVTNRQNPPQSISHRCAAEIKRPHLSLISFFFISLCVWPFSPLHRLRTNESFLSEQNHDSNLKCTSGSSATKHPSQMFASITKTQLKLI